MKDPENISPDYTIRKVTGRAPEKGGQRDVRQPADKMVAEVNILNHGDAGIAGNVRHLVVPDEYAGLRLDQALVKFFPEYSRSRLQEWITQQRVKVSGEFATTKQKV